MHDSRHIVVVDGYEYEMVAGGVNGVALAAVASAAGRVVAAAFAEIANFPSSDVLPSLSVVALVR